MKLTETQKRIERLEKELEHLKAIVNQPEAPNYKSITTIQEVNEALDAKWYCDGFGEVSLSTMCKKGNNATEKEAISVGAYRDLLNVAHLANGGSFLPKDNCPAFFVCYDGHSKEFVIVEWFLLSPICFKTKEGAKWALDNFRDLFEKYYQVGTSE